MKRFIIGFILGAVLFGGISFATRMEQPATFYDLTNPNEITNLNLELEKIKNILNGRITFNIDTALPTVNGSEGDMKFSNVGGVYKMHAFINGAWRSWTSD